MEQKEQKMDFPSQHKSITLCLEAYCPPKGVLLISAQSAEFHLSAAPQDGLPCLGHTAHPEMKGGTLGYNTAPSEMLPTLINDPTHISSSPVKESPAPLNSTGFFGVCS